MALARVDSWSLWENANEEPTIVANSEDHLETIFDEQRWDQLKRLSR